jgi:uncharacterized protein DUF4019
MKKLFAIALMLTLLAAFGAAAALAQTEAEGDQAATVWLALIDKGAYGEAYKASAPFMQHQLPSQRWLEIMKGAAAKTGKAVDRKLLLVKPMASVPGAPAGQFLGLLYSPNFKGLPLAIEQLVLMSVDGKWKVLGYRIK